LSLQVGCGRSQPARFYVLSSTIQEEASSAQAQDLKDISIGIGPVELADYMLRPQILTYERAGKLEYAEFDRWAEPLDDNFARVIAQNLSLLIPTEQIFIFPFRGTARVKYQLVFEILRFSKGADGQVTLIVLWSVYDQQEYKLLTRKKSTYHRPGPTGEESYYENLSTAMSLLLEDFARDLAAYLGGGPR
jgi:uncharacterized lipoprotein YmbA